ncbi:putative chitinase 3 [Eufriesea mexicana]|uniref:Putative chitinase 3 n=1 Tax=Eufriesea mexicana TaxID=516756 RepID=A0A310S7M1_9HYME|nr:putative chitinase 3 [Eufriesea mexicana]
MPYVSPRTDQVQAIQHQDIARKDSDNVSLIKRSGITMRFILILLTLVLGLCDAARRTTTAASTLATFGERHLGHPQQQDLENVWDLVELQKLDNHANTWNQNPPSTNGTESQGPDFLSTRQIYPSVPSPGDTNELPGPITAKPIPVITPPPGCYALRGQFPSPKSCANYLNCWDDMVTEQTCPDGLLFNDVTLVCDYDYNVNCGNRPLPTPKPPLPDGSKLCPEPNGRYRSATNCSEFYVCVYRKPIKFGCPRGLVYNDILGVCDYPYNVDCKGAATPPLPLQPTSPQTQSPSLPPQPPTLRPAPPTLAPSPSYGPSQPPSYVPSQSPQQSQSPSYGPSQPPQPLLPPAYVSAQGYPSNPWLNKTPDPWHQRPAATQIEIDKEQQILSSQPSDQLQNPWNLVQSIPPSLSMIPCKDGDVHRNARPQLLQCLVGYSYDRPSDSCKPFSIAKW